MKILVTGANGQLGSEIVSRAPEFPEIEFLFTDVAELDLGNFDAVRKYCLDHNPAVIINCAAYTAVDVAETDKDLAALINTKVPAFLGKTAKEIGARLIHISTDYVFDGLSYQPYVETDLVDPDSVYGKTKLNGEIALVKELPGAIIIRTSWLYSSHGKNFVKTMIKLGEDRDQLKVVADQVGTPTYAGDLADAILSILKKYVETPESWKAGIYHYSNEGVCSWFDFAKSIHEIAGIDCKVIAIPTEEYPTAARRPQYSVLNKAKIKRNYGLEIPYWRDSLKLCIQKYYANRKA